MSDPANHPSHRSGPRVGYLLKTYPRFSQTFIVNEILELERQGLEVHIVSMCRPGDGMFHEAVSRVRAQAYYLPETIFGNLRRTWETQWRLIRQAPRAYAAAGRWLRSPGAEWSDLVQAGHLLTWVRKRRIDHVHVHFGTNEATVALLAHQLGGLPYSMTLHAFDIFRDNVDRKLLTEKINRSRFTVTVTEYNRNHLITQLAGVDADRILVRYNGIDLERFCDVGRPRDASLVLGVGRLIEKKGFDHLVRAIRRLRDQELPITCQIVGDGPEEGALGRQIERAGLAGNVLLTGPLKQEEVYRLMQQAACFVLPCVRAKDGNIDALPTVLLEAFAVGCPCISTRLSGVPEIIDDGVSGLLVEAGDDEALASAIRRVLEDPALAARLARAARERVQERFDIRRTARALHDCFLQAVRGTGDTSEPATRPAEVGCGQVGIPART